MIRTLSLFIVVVLTFSIAATATAQAPIPPIPPIDRTDRYGAANTFSLLTEYSNDSSHIFLGVTPHRKFTALGAQYQRRLLAGRQIVWSYTAEIRPLIFESDPTAISTTTATGFPPPSPPTFIFTSESQTFSCQPGTAVFTTPSSPIVSTVKTTCGRQWNFAQSFSPIGTRVNLLTHHRIQPTVSGSLGYMFSTHPIPVRDAGSFNFVFEFGAGLEVYRAPRRSVRIEYQIQHFSNKDTAPANPGVDNGLFKLTYAFGR